MTPTDDSLWVGQSLITVTPQQSEGCRQRPATGVPDMQELECNYSMEKTKSRDCRNSLECNYSKVTEEEISAARSGEQVLAKGGFAVALTRQPDAVCKPQQQRKKESFLQGKGEGKFRFMQQKQP